MASDYPPPFIIMASHLKPLFSLLLLLLITPSFAQQSSRPNALVIPVTKDASSLQYVTQINQRTPLVPVNLTVDLGGQFLWVDCEQNYISSTYRPVRCGTHTCTLAGATGCGNCSSPQRPGCNNNTCGVTPDNTVTHTATGGELAQDIVSVQSTNGFNPARNVSVSGFIFSCAPTFLLKGLANGVSGMAGLGRTRSVFHCNSLSLFDSKENSPFVYRQLHHQKVSSSSETDLTFFFQTSTLRSCSLSRHSSLTQ